MYATCYILNENLLCTSEIGADELGTKIGLWGLGYCSIYLVLYTFPHWHAVVLTPMQAHSVALATVLQVYGLLAVSSCLHSLAYYGLVRAIGATATGVLQAFRAILVFTLSSLLFCQHDTNQCFNYFKGVASLIVFVGVMIFSMQRQA